MYAKTIEVGHFIGPHQVKHRREYVQSGTRMVLFGLSNGKERCVRLGNGREQGGWVDGARARDLAAGQVRVATRVELKAGIRERQTARDEHLTGLVTTRRA
jgi:hypothetical protein